jgi:hypothetical protein
VRQTESAAALKYQADGWPISGRRRRRRRGIVGLSKKRTRKRQRDH